MILIRLKFGRGYKTTKKFPRKKIIYARSFDIVHPGHVRHLIYAKKLIF